MSLRSRSAWIVAASVGAVEAMKDQGFARWNYPIRMLHQRAKNNFKSYIQAKNLAPSSSHVANKAMDEKAKKLHAQEESLRTVMYLSCWGPNS